MDSIQVVLGDLRSLEFGKHAADVHAGRVGEGPPGHFTDHPPGILLSLDCEDHLS